MKKVALLLVLVLSTVFVMSACGGSATPDPAGGQGGGNQEDGNQGSGNQESEGQGSSGQTDGELKIAVIAAVTGTSASDGASMANAVQMAVDEINAKGGALGKNLTVDVIDGGSTPDSALNIAQKVASSKDYVAVFGPHFSSQILAIGDTLAQAEVPVITGGTVKKVLETVTSDWVIRNRCPDTVVAYASAKFMHEELGVKKVGFICANDDFGTGARQVAQEYFDSVGVEYVSETFNIDDNDMTSQLLKLKDSGIDSLFVWSLGTTLATVIRQVGEQGLNTMPVMASGGLTFPDIRALLDPEVTENWYVNTHWPPTLTDEASVAFTKRFDELYGIEPNMLAAAWYSTTYWLTDCLERAGSAEPDALLKAMQETKDYATLSGTFTYKDRDLIRDVMILQQVNKEFKFITAVTGE